MPRRGGIGSGSCRCTVQEHGSRFIAARTKRRRRFLAQLSRHQSRSGGGSGEARAGVNSRRGDRPSPRRVGRLRQIASRRAGPARRSRRADTSNCSNRCWPKARSWPAAPLDADWLTFAGNPQRNKTAASLVDVGAVAWRIPLRHRRLAQAARWARSYYRRGSPRAIEFLPASDRSAGVWSTTIGKSWPCDATRGQPAWGRTAAIYRKRNGRAARGQSAIPTESFGSPRFTMTVFRDRALRPHGLDRDRPAPRLRHRTAAGYLVCLDLAAEGRLLWKIAPEEGWAFEGAPLADERGVYVAMRRHDIRPQAFVACFDADTGRLALAAIHLRRRDARPRHAARANAQPADALLRHALLQHQSRRGGGPAGRRRPDALGQPVSPRVARRSGQARAALAARAESLPVGSRHAAGRPAGQPAHLRLRRRHRPDSLANRH